MFILGLLNRCQTNFNLPRFLANIEIRDDFKMFAKSTAADRWLIGFAFSFCATAGGCKNNPRNTVLPLSLMVLADVTCVRGVCVKLPAILWVKSRIIERLFLFVGGSIWDFLCVNGVIKMGWWMNQKTNCG